MIPEDVITKMTRCDLRQSRRDRCLAHDEHEHCEIHWEPLQEWMERVERALTDVRGTL